MKEFGICLLFVVGLLGGGMIGYSLGVVNMQEEAIAQGVATWKVIPKDATFNGKQSTMYEFGWYEPIKQP